MVKPFLPKELLFRVNAILRRSYKAENPLVKLRRISFGTLFISLALHNEFISKPFHRYQRNRLGRILFNFFPDMPDIEESGVFNSLLGNCVSDIHVDT